MFREGNVCSSAEGCEKSTQCNLTALSMNKIFLLQTPLYRSLKDSRIVKKIRQKHRGQYWGGETDTIKNNRITENTAADYQKLCRYYGSMVAMFDKNHANSTMTSNVFRKYFSHEDIKVIHITHSNIKDNRQRKVFSSDRLRLTYLGSNGGCKGFFFLRRFLMYYG